MESKQLRYNTVCSILNQIDNFYINKGNSLANSIRFDTNYNRSDFDFRLVSAFERILRTELCEKRELITDNLLEKMKLHIQTTT